MRTTLQTSHIVFSGGGTAGHLNPGLAVAAELRAQAPSTRITFAGTGREFERRLVEEAGYDYLGLPCHPFAGGPAKALRFVLDNFSGYRAAKKSLKANPASLVVGLGGYASVPMARAASSLGVPLVLLEQNMIAGRATRWLAPRATLVCAAFEQARSTLQTSAPIQVTGNPVRYGFSTAAQLREELVRPNRRLVVLGGSGGARSLNEQVPRALYKLRQLLGGWTIVHQTGAREASATAALYRKFDLDAMVTPFVRDMPGLFQGTDLAICRAGGTTLAELAAAEIPTLLVPYPAASNQHQLANAQLFVDHGAAVMVNELTVPSRLDNALRDALQPLLISDQVREAMGRQMASLARPDAAWRVATLIGELLTKRQQTTAA